MYATLRRFLLAVPLIVMTVPAVAQPPGDEVKKVASLWEQRRKAVTTAEYKLSWETFPTRPQSGDPKPGENGVNTGKGTALIDFVNGWLKTDQLDISPQTIYPDGKHVQRTAEYQMRSRMVLGYDGKDQYFRHILERFASQIAPPKYSYDHGAIGPLGMETSWPSELHPLFWSHGFVRTVNQTNRDGDMPLHWQIATGDLIPAGRSEIDGRSCLSFKLPGRDGKSAETYWVDELSGAVVQHRHSHSAGEEQTNYTFRETPHGRFPDGWTVTSARLSEQPKVYRRVRVESATYDRPIPVDEFRIAFPPGLTVTKTEVGGPKTYHVEVGLPHGLKVTRSNGVSQKTYQVGPDGQLVPAPEPSPRDEPEPSLKPPILRGSGWLIGCASASVVGLGVLLVRLRRRRIAVDAD
jgi:hypothetical protein